MGTVWFPSLLLMALWLATAVSGCATRGDLDTLKQEVLQSYVEQTESLESHKVDTRIQFDVLKRDILMVSQDLKADYSININGVSSAVAKLSQELNGLREHVTDLDTKSDSVLQEREKVHAALQSATRRILFLFKKEESELKERIRFLQEVIKEYGAEAASKQ